tara:strand:- start:8955 stop:9299 length:345 start_codon:yes stop_codon:yes gene_type:complete
MMMTLNLSSNAFFELSDFAVECQWTIVSSNDKYNVIGIFDNTFYEAFNEFGSGVSTSSPVFTMKSDDIPDGASDQNDLLLVPITSKGRVAKISYRIKVIEKDGTGVSTIRLQKQ